MVCKSALTLSRSLVEFWWEDLLQSVKIWKQPSYYLTTLGSRKHMASKLTFRRALDHSQGKSCRFTPVNNLRTCFQHSHCNFLANFQELPHLSALSNLLQSPRLHDVSTMKSQFEQELTRKMLLLLKTWKNTKVVFKATTTPRYVSPGDLQRSLRSLVWPPQIVLRWPFREMLGHLRRELRECTIWTSNAFLKFLCKFHRN